MAARITDPSKWAGNWGTRVGSSGDKWSSNYVAAGPEIFQRGAAAVSTWQTAVASDMAASAFVKGLNNVNFSQVQATVNGPGKSKYTMSGTQKQAKYATFAQVFGPKLQTIVSNLPPRGPRGSAQNRTRLTQLLDQVQATRGSN
jgi:hypothetical protein